MSTSSGHLQDHVRGRAGAVVAGVALLSVVLSGCGQPRIGSGAAGGPPRLHLVTGSNATGRDAAPAAVGNAGFGGYVLVGSLPDQPTRAPVLRWPAGAADVADVQRLTRTLAMTGTPIRHEYGWAVTGATGTVRVHDGGGHPWSYSRADRADCPPISVDIDHRDGAVTGTGCAVAVSPGQPAPTGPTASATRTTAAPLLAALGISPTDVAAAQVYVGYPDSTLSVSSTVDGMPTAGLETSVTVDRTGIAGASGRLQLPTAGDVYPLRTAKQAFDELANGPRPDMAPYCGPIPPESGQTPASKVTPVPCPSPVPVPVTGARIGLLLSYDTASQAQGPAAPLMVPAWFFTIAGVGLGPAVIAIDPSFLAPPEGSPPTNPAQSEGTAPGSGSAGSAGPNPPATPENPPVGTAASPKR